MNTIRGESRGLPSDEIETAQPNAYLNLPNVSLDVDLHPEMAHKGILLNLGTIPKTQSAQNPEDILYLGVKFSLVSSAATFPGQPKLRPKHPGA